MRLPLAVKRTLRVRWGAKMMAWPSSWTHPPARSELLLQIRTASRRLVGAQTGTLAEVLTGMCAAVPSAIHLNALAFEGMPFLEQVAHVARASLM